MRKAHADLPRYTWDQATILNVWPASAFAAHGVSAATIRSWASREVIKPVGVAPNGHVLYSYADVIAAPDRPRQTGGRGKKRHAELPPCNLPLNLP